MLREDSVFVGRIGALALLAVIAGCATGGPAHFGQYTEFTPKVAATKGERQPLHVTVQLVKPANVAVPRSVIVSRATVAGFVNSVI